MPKAAALSEVAIRAARFRQRLRAAGREGILLQLPRETVKLLDELKVSQGLRSRSQAFLQLLEEKGTTNTGDDDIDARFQGAGAEADSE